MGSSVMVSPKSLLVQPAELSLQVCRDTTVWDVRYPLRLAGKKLVVS